MPKVSKKPQATRTYRVPDPTRAEKCPRICLGCDEACERHISGSHRMLEFELPHIRPQALADRLRQTLLLLAQGE